jgi:hypothetical protein
MSSAHFYPDLSDPRPTFMLGQFDLDDTDPGSPFMLGEAMLRFRKRDELSVVATPIHQPVRMADSRSSPFLFGLLAEQPIAQVPDDLILNLWATEQV